ncbi:MAG: T9SS type A sorting domain-containing protein [Sediminibacterium sp.]|nr:T9SS type A sorting domain-containing protein [Sediminibacterium sp.]
MKKLHFCLFLFIALQGLKAQQTGDTVIVKTIKYGSSSRDTAIQFPNGSQTYEKIIMRYNMRCKNGLISTQSQRDLGCGEWDASCNSYIVDSSKVNDINYFHPNYIIANFSGSAFNYVNSAPYNYYNFAQTNVTYSVNSETQYTVGSGATVVNHLLNGAQKSGKTQLLYTAAELAAAGYTAGSIDGIMLNVSNAGGAANFFRMAIKHTTVTALSNLSINSNSFTNVFNQHYSFVNGTNRIQFHTPFMWDGTSNIIIEYSFTNSTVGSSVTFNGTTTSTVMALYANNNYALDLSNDGHAIINTALMSSVSNEITVSFWAYGNNGQIPSNSILYATPSNTLHRSLNIHIPWGNTVYFDCGSNSTGSYDRLSKVATATNIGGQWNHWAFIKNTSTGDMRIVLNGVNWAFTSNKPYVISLVNMILGKDIEKNNNYKGKINELAIWNRELSVQEIRDYYKTGITNAHPYYNNLVAYYKMDEGTGILINDTKNSQMATGVNTSWTYDRGHTLNRMFKESLVRPSIVFLRGNYALNTTTVTVKDSLQSVSQTIRQYSITSNAGAVPFTDDIVTLAGTFQAYQAISNTYNGDTGALTGSVNITPAGTYSITNLNYFKRIPNYIELSSFVTPYGIGLDLGMKGKTWYFDVSDYAPVLKGKKRFTLTGGVFQEQLDIDFLFILGTPPRTVLDFNQLWPVTYDESVPIDKINNNSKYPPLNLLARSDGKGFKVRSSITGHGAEGEFGQNGGIIQHQLNINGGANEFSWPITQSCAFNPVYPQGGTWVYNRQGWCPGQPSLLKENYITPYVTPGSSVTIDYNCSSPPNPNGTYHYVISHQLVTYSGANHNLDANLVDVIMPSNKVLYSRINPMCANPVIMVQNTGSTALTALQIDYWLNNASSKQSYTWTGNLAFMDTTRVTLPIGTLWQSGLQPSDNVFNVELKTANATTDQYAYNNQYHSPFSVTDVLTNTITVEFKTNNYPSESSYKLVDENGNTLPGASTMTAANTIYANTYQLNSGCYRLVVTDSGEDGLQWWANSAQGAGFVRFKNEIGTIIKTFQPDFGGGFEYSFSTASLQSLEDNELSKGIRLYPNPAHHQFFLSGEALDQTSVEVEDVLGRNMNVNITKEQSQWTVDTKTFTPGVYMVKIAKDGKTATRKIVVY